MPAATAMCATSRALEPNQRWATIHSWNVPSSRADRSIIGRVLGDLEPVEAARRERQQVRELADLREPRAAEHLDRAAALGGRQVELDGLRRAREVVDAQH